jgi:large subunit ribosomal protein L25
VSAVPGRPAINAQVIEPAQMSFQPRSDPMPSASTSRPTLAAVPRDVLGKKVARLRREGQLPGVVFGHSLDSTPVSVDAHDFELLRRRVGQNALVDLSVDSKQAQPVLIHGVQVHPVTRRPLHVDLFLVRMTEELTVDVPLVPTGVSEAVVTDGGTLLHGIESVRIKALPDHLPQSIEYSIESLVDFDTSIHVRDLTIPSDVTLLTDPEEVVAKVQAPRIEVEEEPVVAEGEEGVEGEEPAEGEAGEAGTAPSGGSDEEDSGG